MVTIARAQDKSSTLESGKTSEPVKSAKPEAAPRASKTAPRNSEFQHTLAGRISLTGVGVHKNAPATVTLNPAEADTGIVFVRTDLADEVVMEATWRSVSATELCTVLAGANGATISTIEHLMAALRALEIDNALIEVDGPEMPIMDGSSAPFVEAIRQVGVLSQAARRSFVKVLKPVRVEIGDGWGELSPCATTRFEVEIDFELKPIGRQSIAFDLTPDVFADDFARARTFGRIQDVERLWQMGFALGASLENSVAVAEDRVLNPEGTRWPDEFVRHKALDAVGDLALSGLPIRGLYRSYKGGHRINAAVLQALFSDPTAYEIVPAPTHPRREQGHAEIAVASAAYGPERG